MSASKDLAARLRRTIFWQCRALGLDEVGRRDALEAAVGKRSLKKINTTRELQKVVEYLVERGAVPSRSTGKGRPRKSSRRPVSGAPGSVDRMITPNQRRTIEKLKQWRNISDDDVRAISRRICKSDFPQTTRGATALILALSKTERKEPFHDSLPSAP